MQVQDILHTIHAMSDRDDIERIMDAARMRRDYLSKASIRVGDTVWFDAGSRGIQRGKVIKINPKRTKVQCGMMTWNVSHSLLNKEEVTA